MNNQKNKPKSLKEQLAPLKAQLKAEENKAEEKKPQPQKATKTPPSPPPPVKAIAAPQPSVPETSPEKVSDADMVEFWRAAAGAVPVGENGRELHPPKKKVNKATGAPPPVTATPVDKETFADLLDLSENTMKQAMYEKEAAKPAPQRAISSKRVELMELSVPQAKERLLRFLKAAKSRGEKVVLVVFGPDLMLKAAVEETLDKVRGELVLHQSDAGEPMAFKVTLI